MANTSGDRPTGGKASGVDPMAAWKQMMEGMAGAAGAPGTAFIASLESTAASVKERRAQVQALVAQLSAFDDQMAAFESSLEPMLAWGRTWVRVQENAMDPFGLNRRPRGS